MLQLIKEFRALWQCKYFGEKGQDLIEYALLLAIVVGIGYHVMTQSGETEGLVFTSEDQGENWSFTGV